MINNKHLNKGAYKPSETVAYRCNKNGKVLNIYKAVEDLVNLQGFTKVSTAAATPSPSPAKPKEVING